MTIQMIRPKAFLAPEPKPLRGTLLDAATLNPGGYSSQSVTALYNSLACAAVDHTVTLPCPPTDLAAPVQAAATNATTTGTLAAGVYRSKITAVNARGETVGSNEISTTTTGTTSKLTFNWAAVTGATGYQVYVTAVGGAANSETLLATVGAVTSYVWTGTPARGTTTVPTTNTAVVPVTKTFDADGSWQDAIQFGVQAGVICKMVGFDPTATEADLERVFNNKESVAVARALMQTRFVDGGTANWDAAVDLTPAGGAVDPVVGLAILEGHASYTYAGAPTLHVPRTIASLLINKYAAIEYVGDILYTELGSKVAADGGYESPSNGPTGSAPAAGELWLYASGEVTVSASDTISRGGPDLVETGDSNRYRILRERAYVATVDCYTAAVRVKVQ
jgi:hypothetical protein